MANEHKFMIGDVVERVSTRGKLAAGFVIGFCPGPHWVRVQTPDGVRRIWAKNGLSNISANIRTIEEYKGIKGA